METWGGGEDEEKQIRYSTSETKCLFSQQGQERGGGTEQDKVLSLKHEFVKLAENCFWPLVRDHSRRLYEGNATSTYSDLNSKVKLTSRSHKNSFL